MFKQVIALDIIPEFLSLYHQKIKFQKYGKNMFGFLSKHPHLIFILCFQTGFCMFFTTFLLLFPGMLI